MKQENKGSLARFVEDKGFYIILCLCVAAIGVSGYVLFFGEEKPVPTVIAGPETPRVPAVKPDPHIPQPRPEVRPGGQELPKIPEVPAVPEVTPTMRPEKPRRLAPVPGKVMRKFSGQQLVYDETMCDWRTHNGTDFAAEVGQEVAAVAAGRVGAVWQDDLRGSCLRLDCGEGIFVTYCGLDLKDGTSVGMPAEPGTVLGHVGTGMMTESCQPPHLHIEVVQNGQYLDPEQFLR